MSSAKITIIICMTFLVSCILFISYTEYTDRYHFSTTQGNTMYIFDKKTKILNKCSDTACIAIPTQFPDDTNRDVFPSGVSRLFYDKSMVDSSVRNSVKAVETKLPDGDSTDSGDVDKNAKNNGHKNKELNDDSVDFDNKREENNKQDEKERSRNARDDSTNFYNKNENKEHDDNSMSSSNKNEKYKEHEKDSKNHQQKLEKHPNTTA